MQTESRRLEYEAPKLEVQELLAHAGFTGSKCADNEDDNNCDNGDDS